VAKFNIGDLVVLKSGSMRMCVEAVDEDVVSTVWCNEGVIGRDNFAPALLNKWEHREDDRGARPRPHGGERGGDRGGDRGGKPPYRGDRDRGGDDRPPRKTGWDGKPRDKKYFRKDDV
jgi:uncharacterized protein YodC (DUF2158 family)